MYRLMIHDSGPLWRCPEANTRRLFEGDGYEYELISLPPQRPGQCCLAGAGTTHLLFWPRSNCNPNLDGREYRVVTDEFTCVHSAGRRQIPSDERLAVDLYADLKIRDFVEGFRRERAAKMWDLCDGAAVSVFMGVTSTGSSSASHSLSNGERCAFLPGWEPPERTKAEIAALTVGTENIPQPDYPPHLSMHHWLNLHGVLPAMKHWAMVRDPVRRMVSKYYWGLDTTGGNGQNIDDWIDGICTYGLGDWQLQWFANIAQNKSLIPSSEIDLLRSHAECEISFHDSMRTQFEETYADAIRFFRDHIGPLRCA